MANQDYQRELAELTERARPRETAVLEYTETAPLPVKAGPGNIIQGDLNRLSGDRDYAAGASIANANGTMVAFNGITRYAKGGSGLIIGAKLTKNNPSVQDCAFRIWLYQEPYMLQPASEDGTPFQIRWRRRAIRIGYLDFTEWFTGFDCSESYAYVALGQSLLFNLPYTNGLYGLVHTLKPYSAVSNEMFSFFLHIAQD